MSSSGGAVLTITGFISLAIGMIFAKEKLVNRKMDRVKKIISDEEEAMKQALQDGKMDLFEAHKAIYDAARKQYITIMETI